MIVQAAKGVCDDLNLQCGPTGVTAQATNRTHQSLLVLSMDVGAFLEYRCLRPVTLGLGIRSLECVLKALRSHGHDMPVRLTVPEDLEHMSFSIGSSEYQLKLLDLDTEFLTIPPQSFQAEASLHPADFRRVCLCLAEFGSLVQTR